MGAQMWEITRNGGVTHAFFPAELLLKSQLKIRGRVMEKSVLDALKKIEGKEGKVTERAEGDPRPTDLTIADEEVPDEDEDDFGGDDYAAGHDDVEDGMGDDFEEGRGGVHHFAVSRNSCTVVLDFNWLSLCGSIQDK